MRVLITCIISILLLIGCAGQPSNNKVTGKAGAKPTNENVIAMVKQHIQDTKKQNTNWIKNLTIYEPSPGVIRGILSNDASWVVCYEANNNLPQYTGMGILGITNGERKEPAFVHRGNAVSYCSRNIIHQE